MCPLNARLCKGDSHIFTARMSVSERKSIAPRKLGQSPVNGYCRSGRLVLPPQKTNHVNAGNQAVKAVAIGHDGHAPGVEDW